MAPEGQRAPEGEAHRQAGRAVSLTVPAKPDYVMLARLALSAVCRLAPLGPEEVADLKLAITEAAADLLADSSAPGGQSPRLSFQIELGEEELVLELRDSVERTAPAQQHELSRAILAATVDDRHYGEGQIRLVKYLTPKTK